MESCDCTSYFGLGWVDTAQATSSLENPSSTDAAQLFGGTCNSRTWPELAGTILLLPLSVGRQGELRATSADGRCVVTEYKLLGDWPNENCCEPWTLCNFPTPPRAREKSAALPFASCAALQWRWVGGRCGIGPDNECIGIVNFCTRRRQPHASAPTPFLCRSSLSLSGAAIPLDVHLTSGVATSRRRRSRLQQSSGSTPSTVCLAIALLRFGKRISPNGNEPEAQIPTNQAHTSPAEGQWRQ